MQEKASGMCVWLNDRTGRRPLFAAALVAMAGVLAVEGGLWVAVAVVFVAGLFGVWFGSWRRGLAGFLCAVVAAGVLAGVDDVLDDVLDESDVLGVALEVDAGVVLLELDLLSVL